MAGYSTYASYPSFYVYPYYGSDAGGHSGYGGYSNSNPYYSYSSDSYPYYNNYGGSNWNGSFYAQNDSYTSSGSASESANRGTVEQSASPAPGNDGATGPDEAIWAAVKRRMDLARPAFQNGDYTRAQRECEQAIRLLPGDINLHEFRALCQFAEGKYNDAAVTLHNVLAPGPGWDWRTLSSFYTGAEPYTKQLRALEQYLREKPTDAAGRFVLAYEYLVLDERDAAITQLQEVVKFQPKDKLADDILQALLRSKNGNDSSLAVKPMPGG